MQITASMVKELRDISGAGMSACKNALVEAEGDIKRATEILREKGLAAAAKKAGRVAAEGLVATAMSDDGKKGAIVEVNSETDFVAKNEDFVAFVKQVAVEALNSDAETVDALMESKWTPDNTQTIKDVLTHKIATIGENIGIRRFEKFVTAGKIIDYIHGGGRIGVMLELACDNLNETVVEAGRNICMQIAAMSPKYLDKDSVPAEFLKSEKEILTQQANNENAEAEKPKPPQVIEKMVEGRLAKQLKEICLLDQEYVKDDKITVASYLQSVCKTAKIVRYVRYEKGEGIEKKEEDFAAEVQKAMNV